METTTNGHKPNGHKPKTLKSVEEVIDLIHNPPPPDAAPTPPISSRPNWTTIDGVGDESAPATPAPPVRPNQQPPEPQANAPIANAKPPSNPQVFAPIANAIQSLKAMTSKTPSNPRKSAGYNPAERLIAVAALVSLGAWLSTGKGIAGFMVFQASSLWLWLYLSVALLLAAVMKWRQSRKMDLLTFSLLAIAMAAIAMLSGFLSWLLLGTVVAAGILWTYTDLTDGGIEYPTSIIAAATLIALISGAGQVVPNAPQPPANQQNVG
ncbi:MAG: hypothetical protein D6694_09180 [Gammaproteobacteria bacterium]|nr:MAG: hypothetical protein D6694_09180 [Gammaproteobacteria bacterium]